jgi:hypothetical protein
LEAKSEESQDGEASGDQNAVEAYGADQLYCPV